jgi:dolichol kinase
LELARRLIHISGILTVALSRVMVRITATFTVLFLAIIYIVSEFMRYRSKRFPVISAITRISARTEELSGWIIHPIPYAAGILIALNMFPKPVNYATIAVLTVGDGFSSLVDGKYGRHTLPYNRSKTVEESTAFFLSSLITTSPSLS